MIIDTHCHLSDERFAGDLEEVIEKAKKTGVEKMIMPSTNLEDAKRVIEIINKYESVYGLAGTHPESVNDKFQILNFKLNLKNKIKNSQKIVGVGEIGMDFYYDKEKKTKKVQVKLFKTQLELALELDLPVVIHSRGAEIEIKEILDDLQGKALKGQFHCFGESEEFLRYVLGKGFYVSFCGNITYKSAGHLRRLLKRVPVDRLLLETDAPYLPPEGKRGERNTPANVIINLRFIASILDVSPDKLAHQTSKNARCLFSLT